MELTTEILKDICITLIVIAVLFGVTLLVLSNFTRNVYDTCCDKENGTLTVYECQDLTIGFRGRNYIPCSELKTGYFCVLPNGSEIKAENLTCMLNVTVGEV